MSDTRYLTRREAAAACGCSFDTIRRRIADGMPSRVREDGVVEVAIADLVEHGLLDPLAAGGDITGSLARSRTEQELGDTRHELAVKVARVEWLEGRLGECQDEIAFLRGIVTKAAA